MGRVQVLNTDSGRQESRTDMANQPAVMASQNTVPVMETDEEVGDVNMGTHREKGDGVSK